MIATYVQLGDVRDAERLVDASIRRAHLTLTKDQAEELKLEGLVILYEMYAREYDPHRAGYAHAGSFAGYASRYLPGRLISAYHRLNPEERLGRDRQRIVPSPVSLETRLRDTQNPWQPVATVAQHVGRLDISLAASDYRPAPLDLDAIGAAPGRDGVLDTVPNVIREYTGLLFDAVHAFLEADRPDISESLRNEWAAQAAQYGALHDGPQLDLDPPLPEMTQRDIARKLDLSEKTVRNRARLLREAMDRARSAS